MIGKIVFDESDDFLVLNDDLVWEGTEKEVVAMLNDLHSGDDYSPGDGEPGFKLLAQVAESLGGRVESLRTVPSELGLIH